MTENFKSKINYKTLFAVLLLTTILYVIVGIYLASRFLKQLDYRFDILLFSITLILIFIAIVGAIFTYSFFPTIEINKKQIIISTALKSRKILLEQISSIQISDVSEYYGILVDKTIISLKNGNTVELFPFKYSNFPNVRLILSEINEILQNNNFNLNSLEFNVDTSKIDKQITKIEENHKTYNSSHILSFNGLTFYSLILAAIIGFIKNTNSSNSIYDYAGLIFGISLIILIFSSNMNYFIISGKHLFVKNSLIFWQKKCYEINTIKEVEIKQYRRQFGKVIIIKTVNFDNLTYNSDNLTNKQWELFKSDLKAHNILVNDLSDEISQKVLY